METHIAYLVLPISFLTLTINFTYSMNALHLSLHIFSQPFMFQSSFFAYFKNTKKFARHKIQ